MSIPETTPTLGGGNLGDFDFLNGTWSITHRRLKDPWADDEQWDHFVGEATCWSVLSGMASIEELRIPERNFFGMGIRLLDVTRKVWSDYWISGRSGVLHGASTGWFRNGVGTFEAADMDGTTPILSKGIWDQITPTTCRWHQTASRDGGKTWKINWIMEWKRVK